MALSCSICGTVTGQHSFSFSSGNMKKVEEPKEDKYEVINLTVKSRPDGKTWFDVIFDMITENCIPLEDPDNVPDDYECPCGLNSMGGFSGTLDQCYDHERLTEKWAFDVEAADLKIILSKVPYMGLNDKEREAFKRLNKAAYWHEDFQAWPDNCPGCKTCGDKECDVFNGKHLFMNGYCDFCERPELT